MGATPLSVLYDLFETLQVFLPWPEDVHVVFGLSSIISFFSSPEHEVLIVSYCG